MQTNVQIQNKVNTNYELEDAFTRFEIENNDTSHHLVLVCDKLKLHHTVITLSLIDMDRQTQKMGRYVEFHERFPHLLPCEGPWEQPIITYNDGTFDQNKKDYDLWWI